MNQSRNVLCVLLEDHRKEYEAEFARLRQTGANFVFESSPEKSLSMIGEIDPNLVIVGMDVGTMEGIEFLALLTSQYPGFSGSVVVLPEKADGMPPVIHSRTQSTGRSAVEGVDFDHIAALIAHPVAPAPQAAAEQSGAAPFGAPKTEPAPQATPKTEPAPAPQATPKTEPAPEAAPAPTPKRPRRAKWPIPLAAAGGVLLLTIVGYFIFEGGGEAKQNPESTPDPQTVSAVPESGSAKEEGGPVAKADAAEKPADREKEPLAMPEPPVVAPEPPVVTPDPPVEPEVEEHSDLPEEFVLPLVFEEGVGRPKISDRDRLDSIVDALKKQPTLKIELTGHTSAPGEVSNNFKLGMLRARMTKNLLVRCGISPRRVKLKSHGEKEPVDSGTTREGNVKNRRVEIRLIP